MDELTWISTELAVAIHARQIVEHGGGEGIRDQGMLESALARPRQAVAYDGPNVDMPALAAAYAYEIVRNHPFVDGNKRTAYVICRTFLMLNGWDLVGALVDRYPVFLGLVAGEIDQTELTDWLRRHSRPDRVNEARARYA